MIIQRATVEQFQRPEVFRFEHNGDGTKTTEDFVFCREVGGCVIDTQYICTHYRDVNLSDLENWQVLFAADQQRRPTPHLWPARMGPAAVKG